MVLGSVGGRVGDGTVPRRFHTPQACGLQLAACHRPGQEVGTSSGPFWFLWAGVGGKRGRTGSRERVSSLPQGRWGRRRARGVGKKELVTHPCLPPASGRAFGGLGTGWSRSNRL